MSYHLNVLIDDELERAIRHHADQAGILVSQAVRDLLRHAVGVVSSSRDAGWYEGYYAAAAQVRQSINTALTEITPNEPAKKPARKKPGPRSK